MTAPRPYQPEDDEVICALYPDCEAIQARLPGRSRSSLRGRAFRLGVSNRPSVKKPRWQEADDEIIRSLYPDYKAIYARLPNHTHDAVRRRAVDIGVTAGRCGGPATDARFWTDEERALAKRRGVIIPGRTRFALVSFRHRNGIKVDPVPRPEATPPRQRAVKARPERVAALPKPKIILLSVPAPKAWKRQGNEISPRVIAAAARSRHGIELIATVQRAVPRETWPHLKPLVVEQVALAVLDGGVTLDALAEAVWATTTALVARQFEGSAA